MKKNLRIVSAAALLAVAPVAVSVNADLVTDLGGVTGDLGNNADVKVSTNNVVLNAANKKMVLQTH